MVDVNKQTFLVSKLSAETQLPRSIFLDLEDFNLRAI